MKKINCGGFYINEDNFEITDDGELKLKNGSGGGSNVMYCPIRSDGPYIYAEKTTRELAQAETIIFEEESPGLGTSYNLCVMWGVGSDGGFFSLVLAGENEAARLIRLSAAMDDYPTNDPLAGMQ